jgi:hypothetical protein
MSAPRAWRHPYFNLENGTRHLDALPQLAHLLHKIGARSRSLAVKIYFKQSEQHKLG